MSLPHCLTFYHSLRFRAINKKIKIQKALREDEDTSVGVLSIPWSTLNFQWQPVTSKTNDRDAPFDRGTRRHLGESLDPSRRISFS